MNDSRILKLGSVRWTIVAMSGLLMALCGSTAFAQSTLPVKWFYSPVVYPECIAYSPDGTKLAVAGSGGIQIYSTENSVLLYCVPTSATVSVNSVAFSPDSKSLVVGGQSDPGGVLELWQLGTMKETANLATGATEKVLSVAFSPDGKTIAAGGLNASVGVVELWTVATGKRSAALSTSAGTVLSVAFSPNAKYLAVGGFSNAVQNPGVIELWSLSNNSVVGKLNTSAFLVNSVAFSSDSAFLGDGGVGGESGGVVELWKISTQKQLASFPTTAINGVSCVSFCSDGKTLCDTGVVQTGADSFSWKVELWSITTTKLIASLPTNASNGVLACAFSPNGKMLTTGGAASGLPVVEQWLVSTAAFSKDINSAVFAFAICNAFSLDNTTLAVGGYRPSGSTTGTLDLWNLSTGKESGFLDTIASEVTTVAFSPIGTTLAEAGPSSTGHSIVELWSVSTATRTAKLEDSAASYIGSITYSPNGKLVAIGGFNRTKDQGVLQIWTPSSGTTATFSTTATSNVACVRFSPDGKSLFAGETGATGQGVIEKWSVADGTLSQTFSSPNFSISSIAVSPNGLSIVAAGSTTDNSASVVQLWDLTSGKLIASTSSGTQIANSVAFSADGTKIIIGNNSGIEIFSASTLEPLENYTGGILSGRGGAGVSISPNGEFIGYNTNIQSAAVSANPFVNGIVESSLILAPTQVVCGTVSIGSLILSAPAPKGGLVVKLSSNSGSVIVAPTVPIAAGQVAASFTVKTLAVTAQKTATITASLNGLSLTSSLEITPPAVASITLNPASVLGGANSVGTVTLTGPAPTGGIKVPLSSSTSSATVLASVTVLAGKTSATFTVKTSAVKSKITSTISATLGGVSKTATLTIS